MKKSIKFTHMKVISYVATGVFIASLIPILWLGMYDFPSLDDFSVGMAARQVWQDSHSVFDTVREAFLETGRLYVSWAGTFSTVFLMALCPAVFSERIYCIVPYLMIGLLSFSIWYFVYSLLKEKMNADKYLTNIIAMLVLIYTVQNMPSPVEGYYWYTGAVHYIFPTGFLLILLGILLHDQHSYSTKKKIVTTLIMSILAIMIGGGNYMTALAACIICCAIVCKWVLLKEKSMMKFIPPFFLLYLSFALNVFAPGNSVRQTGTAGYSPIKAIFMSFYECAKTVIDITISWKTLCFILIMLPFIWILVSYTKFSFKYPLLVIAGSYCLMSSVFTPCLYGVGNVSSGRLQNTIFVTYVIILLINLVYVLGWLKRHLKSEQIYSLQTLTKKTVVYLLIVSLLLIISSIYFIRSNRDYYVTVSAISTITSGEASLYNAENLERLAILKDEQVDDVELTSYSAPPSLLYVSDITEDVSDWRNKAMSSFYSKNSVVLVN